MREFNNKNKVPNFIIGDLKEQKPLVSKYINIYDLYFSIDMISNIWADLYGEKFEDCYPELCFALEVGFSNKFTFKNFTKFWSDCYGNFFSVQAPGFLDELEERYN